MARTFTKNQSNYLSLGIGTLGGLLSGAEAVSVSAWIRYATLDTASNSNRVISGYTTATSLGLRVMVNSDGTLHVGARAQPADAYVAMISTATIAALVWAHVGGVLNFAAGTITPYVGGAASGGGAVTFGATSYTPGLPTGPDSIGSTIEAGGPTETRFQWDGQIGHVAIWRGALSAAEMAALASRINPLRVRTPALVGYWPLDYSGATEPNLAGGTGLGTITGSLPYAAGPGVMALADDADDAELEPATIPVYRTYFYQRQPLIGVG